MYDMMFNYITDHHFRYNNVFVFLNVFVFV